MKVPTKSNNFDHKLDDMYTNSPLIQSFHDKISPAYDVFRAL